MNDTHSTSQSVQHNPLKSYVTGFVLSLVLTLVAYAIVTAHIFNPAVVVSSILFLALLQFVVQVVFFLHLNREKSPRLDSFIFFTTLSGVFIVVVGSIWIMNHLNYNMMPSSYFMEEEAITR